MPPKKENGTIFISTRSNVENLVYIGKKIIESENKVVIKSSGKAIPKGFYYLKFLV